MSSQQPPPYGSAPPSRRRPPIVVLVVLPVAAALVVAGGAVTAALLTGGDDGTGSDQPSAATAETGTKTAETRSRTAETGTRGLNPCDLLSTSEEKRLSLSHGEKDGLAPRTCSWDLRGGFATLATVRVWVQDGLGLAVISDGRTVRIGTHDAIQSVGPTTGQIVSRQVAIGVTGTSRVDVVVNSDDQRLAYALAVRVADYVEPRLP